MQNGYDRSIATPTKWFRNETLSHSLSFSLSLLPALSVHLFVSHFLSSPSPALSLAPLSLRFSTLARSRLSLCQSCCLIYSPALSDRPTSGSRPRSILAEITSSVGSVAFRKSDSAYRTPRRRKLRRDALSRARKRNLVRDREENALFSVSEPRCNLKTNSPNSCKNLNFSTIVTLF